jgi:hypothetical protein
MQAGVTPQGDGSIPAGTLQLPVQAAPEPATTNVLDNDLQFRLRKSAYNFSRSIQIYCVC